MFDIIVEEFLCTPVIICLAGLLVILSIRFIIKIVSFLFVIIALWASLSYMHVVPSPIQFIKTLSAKYPLCSHCQKEKKAQKERVICEEHPSKNQLPIEEDKVMQSIASFIESF